MKNILKSFIMISLIMLLALSCKKTPEVPKTVTVEAPAELKNVVMPKTAGGTSITFTTNDGKKIYVDPVGFSTPVNDADYIFISHTHNDHFQISSIQNLKNDKTKIVITKDGVNSVKNLFDQSKITVVEPGKDYAVDMIKFSTVAAYNIIDARKQWHPKSMNWVGFILNVDSMKYFISSSTDVVPEMKGLNVDVTFLVLAGSGYTMDYKEGADLINNTIKTRIVVPYHLINATSADEFAKLITNGTKCVIYKNGMIEKIIN